MNGRRRCRSHRVILALTTQPHVVAMDASADGKGRGPPMNHRRGAAVLLSPGCLLHSPTLFCLLWHGQPFSTFGPPFRLLCSWGKMNTSIDTSPPTGPILTLCKSTFRSCPEGQSRRRLVLSVSFGLPPQKEPRGWEGPVWRSWHVSGPEPLRTRLETAPHRQNRCWVQAREQPSPLLWCVSDSTFFLRRKSVALFKPLR